MIGMRNKNSSAGRPVTEAVALFFFFHYKAPKLAVSCCAPLSTSRCDPVRGGRLPVALLAAAGLCTFGAALGESSWAEGGSQKPGEAEEDLLAPAAGPAAAATLEGAEQRPGQVVRHHTR